MPPKRQPASRQPVAAVSSMGERSGRDPGAYQLPPYRADRPSLWFRQAEGHMRMRLITDEDFKVTLVASALSHAQQDAVARILDQDPMPAGTYNILKTELLRLHEKSAWDRVAELFAMPAMGGQTASELLAAMRNLQPPQPDEEELLFRYMFFTRLPASTQRQLAEAKGTVEDLAARADELHRKAPKAAAATIAAATPESQVAAATHQHPPRKTQRGAAHSKRKRSDAHGGSSAAKRRRDTGGDRKAEGLCWAHWKFGKDAWEDKCEPSCSQYSGN